MKKEDKKQESSSWPTSKKLAVYLAWMLFLYFLSFFTYLLTNQYNLSRPEHFELFFEWEKAFPLIPEFILVYASVPVVFFLPLFFLKTDHFHLLGLRFLYNLLLCGLFFIVIPTKLGFMRKVPEGVFSTLFELLHQGDMPHNLFPSLHISLSATLTLTLSRSTSNPFLKAALWFWTLLVCISVVVVHQHHLVDIAGGFGVALGSLWHIRKTPGFLHDLEERLCQRWNGSSGKK